MGACQIDRQSDRLFSRRLACQIVDTQSGICSHSHSFPQQGVTYPIRTHKYIHTHSNVLVWYGAQSVMTVSGPCVIEVMEAETGWGLSSAMSDRKLRWRRWGDGVTVELMGCSLSFCLFCMSHFLPLSPSIHPSFSYICVAVSTFPSLYFCPSTSVALSVSDAYIYIFSFSSWMIFALSSPCQTLHQEKQWETHK